VPREQGHAVADRGADCQTCRQIAVAVAVAVAVAEGGLVERQAVGGLGVRVEAVLLALGF
jgi:hypothetical protein